MSNHRIISNHLSISAALRFYVQKMPIDNDKRRKILNVTTCQPSPRPSYYHQLFTFLCSGRLHCSREVINWPILLKLKAQKLVRWQPWGNLLSWGSGQADGHQSVAFASSRIKVSGLAFYFGLFCTVNILYSNLPPGCFFFCARVKGEPVKSFPSFFKLLHISDFNLSLPTHQTL